MFMIGFWRTEMAHVIQTEALVKEGVITSDQGNIIARRSRQVMVSLVINAVLCFGIIAAAAGQSHGRLSHVWDRLSTHRGGHANRRGLD
jgi:hypothetical protein